MELGDPPSRFFIVARRWFYVLLATVGLIPILLLTAKWQRDNIVLLSNIPDLYLLAPVILGLVGLLWFGGRRFFAFFGTFFWPSFWVSLCAATGASLLLITHVDVLWVDFAVPNEKRIL
jgi:hypothetical protein